MAAELKQKPAEASKPKNKNYKGFVAGVFSGIAKLSGTCNAQFTAKSFDMSWVHDICTQIVWLTFGTFDHQLATPSIP